MSPILIHFREICLALPGAVEVEAWGHPTFRVSGKIFATFGSHEGDWCITVKVGKQVQAVFLQDPRFFKSPYVGQHGWVSLRIAGELDWEEIAELVRGSYQLIAGSRPGRK